MGRWRSRLLGLAVGLGVLVALEGGLRVGLGPPPPPVQVYRALGEQDSWLEARSDGLWPTYQLDARLVPHDTELVVLGGSSLRGGTPGLWRRGEFPGVAGERLKRPVANLGSPGLDTHDHVQVLDALLKADALPELSTVVVYAGHNDFGNARFQARYGTVSAGLAAHLQSGLERLVLYTRLSRLLRPVRGTVREVGVGRQQGALTEAAWGAVLRDLERNLDRLVWQTDKAGLQLVLMAPMSDLSMPPVDPACTADRCPSKDFERGRSTADVAALRRARDTDFIALRSPSHVGELMSTMADENNHVDAIVVEERVPWEDDLAVPSRVLFFDPVHPSAEGHRVLGDLLANHLGPASGERPR